MAQAAKIMLVEDDNNLGEIYEARMSAEGYIVVVAHDGEEALALAAKEKPDLIISDVMMPKISGFEMLDILRNTPGLKDTKVIMLTALGQAEDKTRADSLGADRYLVKSQVTLEDIVDNARALLGDGGAAPAPPTARQAPAVTPTAVPTAATPTPTPLASSPSIPVIPPAPQPPVVASIPVAAPPAGLEQPGLPPAPVTTMANPLPSNAAMPTDPQTTASPAPAAPLQAAAPPAAPAPIASSQAPAPATVTTPPVVPTESSNDKLLNGAVNELLANTQQQAPAQAPSAATTPPEPANNTTVPPQQTASDQSEEAAAANKAPGDNSAQIARKKVIKPISDNLSQKPDFKSLLAAEEGKESAMQAASITSGTNGVQTTVVMPSGQSTTDAAPAAAGQPGNVFAPTGDASKANNNGIDPNSIAL